MGDKVIEELYSLIRDTGVGNAGVIIAPWDLRKKSGRLVPAPGMPEWKPPPGISDAPGFAFRPVHMQSTV